MEVQCIVCQKGIKGKFLQINYDNTIGTCIPLDGPNDEHRKENGIDFGLQPIGTGCAKNYPKTWLIEVE